MKTKGFAVAVGVTVGALIAVRVMETSIRSFNRYRYIKTLQTEKKCKWFIIIR